MSVYTTKSEPILSEIDRLPRFARQEQNPTLGRGGKERGFRGREFPPRPCFRSRISFFTARKTSHTFLF